jgi:hypothetical protein
MWCRKPRDETRSKYLTETKTTTTTRGTQKGSGICCSTSAFEDSSSPVPIPSNFICPTHFAASASCSANLAASSRAICLPSKPRCYRACKLCEIAERVIPRPSTTSTNGRLSANCNATTIECQKCVCQMVRHVHVSRQLAKLGSRFIEWQR